MLFMKDSHPILKGFPWGPPAAHLALMGPLFVVRLEPRIHIGLELFKSSVDFLRNAI